MPREGLVGTAPTSEERGATPFYSPGAHGSCAFSLPKLRHVHSPGPQPAGWLGEGGVSDVLAGAPPRSELAPEGGRQKE